MLDKAPVQRAAEILWQFDTLVSMSLATGFCAVIAIYPAALPMEEESVRIGDVIIT